MVDPTRLIRQATAVLFVLVMVSIVAAIFVRIIVALIPEVSI